MVEYEACILGLRLAVDMGVQEILVLGDSDLLFWSIEFRYIPMIHNEIANALATLASMLHDLDKTYVDPLHIQVRDQHAYCNVVEEELDGEPWFHDIKEYIKSGVYPVHATGDQKKTIRHLANRTFEAANKNIKKILRKIVQSSRQWHEKLPFALLGYRTTVRTSVGATPYLLVYGTEAVIPAEVEIPSLQIIAKAEIDDDEWKRMERSYNKKVRPRKFEVGQLVLKRILPHQAEAKGKFTPNWQGPFIMTKVLPNGALYLTDIEGKCVDMAINSDAVKRGRKFGHSRGSSMRKVWFRGKEFCSVCRDPPGREHGSGPS
ncbi:uncharacterized protein [Nicotiana tomentosiformis]|uniref:uncharacterized protein n=1 Tax=Nicotiana tomentosiformis TaxID=4098 RepID=UPI00388C6EE0